MKAQHLIVSAPIFVGITSVSAFVAPSGRSAFQRRSSTNLINDADSEHYNGITQQMKLGELFKSEIMSVEESEKAHGMPWRDTVGSTDKEDPLLYMPFWEWQMDFMKETLTNLRVVPAKSSSSNLDFSFNDNKEKKARIVNQCYASDEYRKIRMSYYDAGDNTQVFNSVWYPDPKYNLPVLGIDLLAFNRKKYLAIVDFQPLYDDETEHAATFEHLLRPIKDEYDSLKGRMSAKFYDETKFFSQQMLFARFEDEGVVTEDLFPAFQRYVRTHVDLLSSTKVETQPSSVDCVMKRQQDYDTYSAERDPATGLFAAMFGRHGRMSLFTTFSFLSARGLRVD
jgi:15,16-dihydrobiliverdin:ferredoxin oxidoreductase